MANLPREQMRQYMADRRARIKAEMLARLGGACVQCGTTETLEFDHVDPATKVFHISGRGLDKPRALLLAEVDKCQLLCKPHHVEKTLLERGHTNLGEHGRSSTYRRGCRCQECRAYSSARHARQRNRSAMVAP